jgi:hypothetical protein
MGDENEDQDGGAGGDDEKDIIKLPKAKFEERLERASRSTLTRLFGTSDEKKIVEQQERMKKLEEEAATRAAADKTDLERARDEAAKATARAAEAEADAELARQRAHITRLGAERGITNIDLLEHKVFKALDELPEGESELDEVELIEGYLKDPRDRIALGVDAVPDPAAKDGKQQPERKQGATTSPAPPVRTTDRKPPPAAAATPAVDVSKMTPAEYRAWKAQHGIR